MADTVKKIRVLVVDDSAYNRRALTDILASSDRIEVIGSAFDGEDAIRKVLRLKPDAVTLDLEMPRMDGFSLLRWLMINHPVPVFVVSSKESNRSVFKALDLGAADFIVKPQSAVPRMELIRSEIISKIIGVEKLDVRKLVKRMQEAPRLSGPDPATLAALPAPQRGAAAAAVPAPAAPGGPAGRVIVIAASTGGPPAVQQMLAALPAGAQVAVVVAQHMPAVFTGLFAERLDKLLAFRVKEAEAGEVLRNGQVYILPGGQCGTLAGRPGELTIGLRPKLPEDRYAPSADVLFDSAAKVMGKMGFGVVLTGMGDDGAAGTGAMVAAGATVLAESQETAVIFGMPQEALRHRGVIGQPLPQLAATAAAWAQMTRPPDG